MHRSQAPIDSRQQIRAGRRRARAKNQNGIAVFSRTPIRRKRPCPAPSAGLVRWLDIDLPEYGFGICLLHVMAAGSSKKHPTNVAKTRFWEVVLQAAESRLHEPFLFVGYWNTGAHRRTKLEGHLYARSTLAGFRRWDGVTCGDITTQA
jgi:exonuclease III